jgi:hypothetical protein
MPHRHFRNKYLLAAVAATGFKRQSPAMTGKAFIIGHGLPAEARVPAKAANRQLLLILILEIAMERRRRTQTPANRATPQWKLLPQTEGCRNRDDAHCPLWQCNQLPAVAMQPLAEQHFSMRMSRVR